MARPRRPGTGFSLSFLDVMACGLGATVLFLMIISTQVRVRAEKASDELVAQASRLQDEVLDGRKDLVRLRDTRERDQRAATSTAGEIRRLQALIAELEREMPDPEADSLARQESVEQLRADVQRLEEARQRLAASQPQAGTGQRTRSFVGPGNRQYLTGMQMGGSRVLILVDSSASMLARTYVNVIRYRAMPDERKRQAPKWRQVVSTVDWLSTYLQPGTSFQIYVFSDEARSVIDGTTGTWLQVGSAADLDRAVAALRQVVPGSGNSLHQAFAAARELKPAPDNIYLLTDGLPTLGQRAPSVVEMVRPDQRVNYFNRAVRELPPRVPVNVILYQMDGDPDAAGYYWQLALATRGSLLTPSRDWP